MGTWVLTTFPIGHFYSSQTTVPCVSFALGPGLQHVIRHNLPIQSFFRLLPSTTVITPKLKIEASHETQSKTKRRNVAQPTPFEPFLNVAPLNPSFRGSSSVKDSSGLWFYRSGHKANSNPRLLGENSKAPSQEQGHHLRALNGELRWAGARKGTKEQMLTDAWVHPSHNRGNPSPPTPVHSTAPATSRVRTR